MRIYNTLSKKIDEFKPINPPSVGMYSCGMTVYDYAHIGHGRKYVMDDCLRRALSYLGYKVKHVENVTDVGHLSSDEDSGEDKLEKGAEKSGMDVWQTAEFFTKDFYESMDKLNILRPDIIARATDHIKEQVELVERLIKNGFAYDTPEAVYFDVSKDPHYTEFSGQKLEDKETGARSEVNVGEHKKNPADFVLWFKRVGHFKDHIMHWPSPWGDGFPGWHIECSAMSMKYLGETFDIHTGGIDHIPVHHTNEIAQSFGATGKPLANFWVHSEFLMVDDSKMSKSIGNAYRITDIEERGFSPLSLRYFYLGAHYRTKLNFTWQALEGASNAYNKLARAVRELPDGGKPDLAYLAEFKNALENDLNTPEALALLWQLLKDDLLASTKKATLLEFDKVLGFGLADLKKEEIPEDIKKLAKMREDARKNKNFEESDKLRKEIEDAGYEIKDTISGQKIIKI